MEDKTATGQNFKLKIPTKTGGNRVTPESPTSCKACGRDVSDEALAAASIAQYAGYNPMSLQYAESWPAERLADFLACYVCEACRADGQLGP